MNNNTIQNNLYYISLFFIALSGFAQMPIFKRYYVADIPGLGWLAEFYITHAMHYIFAVILTGLLVYTAIDFLLTKFKSGKPLKIYYGKTGLLSGLIITGTLMMVKNLSGIHFPDGLIIFLDISHLVFCITLIFLTALRMIITMSNLRAVTKKGNAVNPSRF